MNWTRGRRRALELNRVISRDRTRGMIGSRLFHQVPACCPVGMAIQKRSDDPPVEDTWKSLVKLLRSPIAYDLLPRGCHTTIDPETLGIGRATSVANARRGIVSLESSAFAFSRIK